MSLVMVTSFWYVSNHVYMLQPSGNNVVNIFGHEKCHQHRQQHFFWSTSASCTFPAGRCPLTALFQLVNINHTAVIYWSMSTTLHFSLVDIQHCTFPAGWRCRHPILLRFSPRPSSTCLFSLYWIVWTQATILILQWTKDYQVILKTKK